jgi:hypothetical protein
MVQAIGIHGHLTSGWELKLPIGHVSSSVTNSIRNHWVNRSLKPCGYLNSIFEEGLDNYIALLWPLESNHFQYGIPPTPSPPWSSHLLFLTQIFYLCAASHDVTVAVSGWRLMFGQIRAPFQYFALEDFSEDE